MNHDPESLASAYLDGELTDDERRLAEADPAAMAEVDELRALRARVADVEPAGDAAHEAAIGAAMAAFHRQYSTPESASDTASEASGDADVVSIWRRMTGPAWLGAAAAAMVLVVAVGVVATRGADDDDSGDFATEAAVLDADDSAESGADIPTEEPAAELPDADADRIAESEMADDVFATDDGETDAAGDADAGDQATAQEPASDGTDESADMAAAESADPADDTAGMIPPLDDPSLHFDDADTDTDRVPMRSLLQLRAAAQYLLDQRDAGRLGATPEYRCEFFNVLGAGLYDDVELDGSDPIEVLIDIDEGTGVVTAVDRDDCEIVAIITLDAP